MLGDGGCGITQVACRLSFRTVRLYFQRAKLDEAGASLERAVQLHPQAHDVLGEANDVRLLLASVSYF